MHHGGDGVADGGAGGPYPRLRRRHSPQRHFRAHGALVEHIVGKLVRGVVLLLLHHAIHLLVGGRAARRIPHMMVKVIARSNRLFVSFAPRRVQLDRVGFTAVRDDERLEVVIVVLG